MIFSRKESYTALFSTIWPLILRESMLKEMLLSPETHAYILLIFEKWYACLKLKLVVDFKQKEKKTCLQSLLTVSFFPKKAKSLSLLR